jgi:hypothetical protein
MKRTRLLAILAIAMVAGLMVTGCKDPMGLTLDQDTRIASHWENAPEVYTLWAGQHINAGTVTVWSTRDTFYVKYDMAANWWLDETHAHVALTLEDIPHSSGGPIPGQFEFQRTHNPRVQTWTYAIPVKPEWTVGSKLYICAHAAAVELDGNGKVKRSETGWGGDKKYPCKKWAYYIEYTRKISYKDVSLPTVLPNPADSVKMAVYQDRIAAEFDVVLDNVPSGYDVFNGHWRGWCSEHAIGITRSLYAPYIKWYNVRLWSSQDPDLPERDLVDNTAWDKVNYLLNHKLPGATATEIQDALWWLLTPSDTSLTNNHPLVGNAKVMHDEALANGDGWRPSMGQWLAVICDAPNYASNGQRPVQRVFIEVDP